MNHVYKVVFNRALGVYQCVSEIAKSQGKSSGKSATSNSTNKISSTFKLTALSVGLGLLGASGSAMAVVYDNGQNNVVSNNGNPYAAIDDTVTGSGTILTVDSLALPPTDSQLLITDSGVVEVANNTLVNGGDSQINISNQGQLNSDIALIGVDEDGMLNITENGTANIATLVTGYQSDGGTITVNNAQLTAGQAAIGYEGTGTLNIVNNATATINDKLIVAQEQNATGSVLVDNANLTSKDLEIGQNGNGSLTASNGAMLNSDVIILGVNTPTSTGNLTVEDAGTQVTATEILAGSYGVGNLSVDKGATITTDSLTLGANDTGNGAIKVDNASTVKVNETAFIGDNGKATLNIENGAKMTAKLVITGTENGGTGEIKVSNQDSELTAMQTLTVGQRGIGNMTVDQGGQITVGDLLAVGQLNKGTLDVKAGGKIDTKDMIVGSLTGGDGIVTATDVGTRVTINDRLVVGGEGAGEFNILNSAATNVKNALSIANKSSAGKSVVNVSDSVLNVDGSLYVGDAAAGTLNISNGASVNTSSTTENIIIGRQTGSNGIVNIDDSNSKLITTANIAVGSLGTGTLNVNNGSSVKSAKDIVVGDGTSGIGTINYNGDSKTSANAIQAKNLTIGYSGKGTVNIKNSFDPTDNSWTIGLNVLDKTIIGNNKSSSGELLIEEALAALGNVIVGNEGSGTLKVINNGDIAVSNISRGINSENSNIYFDHAYLTVYDDQPDLFNNFTNKQSINIGNGGLIIDVENHNVKIDPQAVITGNVGAFDLDKIKGGFFKVGTGTLELSSNTKKWTGETGIANGTLKINGDFSLTPDDILAIGIGVDDEDIVDINQYGKLLVDGNAKIDNAKLKVYVTEAIAGMDSNLIWKDVVKATTRSGEFQKDIIDNNLTVDFVADYSTPNAVHLKMVAPTPEPTPVDPTPEPTPVDPTPEPTPEYSIYLDAANNINNKSAVNLARVIDQAMSDQLYKEETAPDNKLALKLTPDVTGLATEKQLIAAAAQLQPLFMGGANRLITDSNYAVTDAIGEHSQTSPTRNLWAKAIGSDMTHDADGYVTGYNSENYGAIVGIDAPVNPDLNLGVAVSYIESDADTDGHALKHELEAKNWQILGYGNYAASDATSVNFHAGAGQSSVKGERHIQLPSSLTAKSDYDVDTMQAGFGVSHQLGSDTLNVAPFASFNYARAESDGYSEKGAGAYNLTVDENTYESMRWTAGLRFNQAVTPTVSVTGQLAGAIENGDSYSDITASFTDVGSNKFYTQGQESEEAIGIAGIGLAFKPTANTTISANYNGEWRDNYDDQGAAIVFETKF